MTRPLTLRGGLADVDIPDRILDGYGLNEHLIELCSGGMSVDTIITCDNGIAAVQEIAQAKITGMTVIVTDHHEPQESSAAKADA
ncbi:MAG: DHH family phosphoesterase [Blautia sp.]